MSWLVRLTVSVRAGTAMTHIEKMRLQAALQALSGAYVTSAPFAQILSRHFARWQRKPQPRARSDDRAKVRRELGMLSLDPLLKCMISRVQTGQRNEMS